ncbi:hypothetical protein ACFP2T_39080 [Plantactinospora solaniradicis]|uniref:Uncharacterized protein n=1 Tax=Plantactinospora solaniradicis TaxID=1723736 RepID=A0ABW1KKJ8_9ACTN
MYDASLAHLDRLPDRARDDYLRIVERTLVEVPARWRSRIAVPVLWLTLDASDGDDIEVERVDLLELHRQNGYPDEFSRWVGVAVRSRMTKVGARCTALFCHQWMSSSIRSPLLHTLTGEPERHVFLHATHRDASRAFRDAFRVQRGPLRRLRFVPEVHRKLADARRTWPDRTDLRPE